MVDMKEAEEKSSQEVFITLSYGDGSRTLKASKYDIMIIISAIEEFGRRQPPKYYYERIYRLLSRMAILENRNCFPIVKINATEEYAIRFLNKLWKAYNSKESSKISLRSDEMWWLNIIVEENYYSHFQSFAEPIDFYYELISFISDSKQHFGDYFSDPKLTPSYGELLKRYLVSERKVLLDRREYLLSNGNGISLPILLEYIPSPIIEMLSPDMRKKRDITVYQLATTLKKMWENNQIGAMDKGVDYHQKSSTIRPYRIEEKYHAKLLAALYNNAKPCKFGTLIKNGLKSLGEAEAKRLLNATKDIDCLNGRVIKVRFDKEDINFSLYLKNNDVDLDALVNEVIGGNDGK